MIPQNDPSLSIFFKLVNLNLANLKLPQSPTILLLFTSQTHRTHQSEPSPAFGLRSPAPQRPHQFLPPRESFHFRSSGQRQRRRFEEPEAASRGGEMEYRRAKDQVNIELCNPNTSKNAVCLNAVPPSWTPGLSLDRTSLPKWSLFFSPNCLAYLHRV